MIGLELLLAMFLLFQLFLRRFTYPAVITLLGIFIVYLSIVILKQGNSGNCGCFGNKLEMSPAAAIWKNVAMIAATILLWFIYPTKSKKKTEMVPAAVVNAAEITDYDTPKNITLHENTEANSEEMLTETIPAITQEVIEKAPKKGFKESWSRFRSALQEPQYKIYFCLLVGTVAFTTPFLINNVFTGTEPVKFTKTIDFTPLYKFDPAPQVDIMKGKHIVAFMSLTCPHCKKAAYLLQIIHHEHPDIPIFMVLNGPDTFKTKFFNETHASDVPYMIYHHTNEFAQMAGSGVPSIYWVRNGVAELKSTYAYYQLDPAFMEEWLKKP